MSFNNLDWQDGRSSIPGIYPEVYYIEKSLITAWPAFKDAPTTPEEEVTYVGSFTLEANAVFKKINCIDVKSQPTSEPQGEIRCVSSLNKMSILTSLTNAAATAFVKKANNTDLVYIYQERDSGKFRVCGSEKFTTLTKAKLDVGSNPSGERGTSLEVESADIMPFPFYDGSIITADGDVNPPATAG